MRKIKVRLSVVIPTFNEQDFISGCVRQFMAMPEVHEIIVSDGNSTDHTRTLAAQTGAIVLNGRRQRAAQLNHGAAQATGNVLLFVHADTRLGVKAALNITRALGDPHAVGGAFRRRFAPPYGWLGMTSRLADLRCLWWGLGYGDQALFVRRSIFEDLDGFSSTHPYEDPYFSIKLKQNGRFCLLGPPLVTSGRRFKGRPLAILARDAWVTWKLIGGQLGHGRRIAQ